MPEPLPALPRALVDAAGVSTGYYHAGRPEAPPVVLLHGMSASADSFRELMHALADEFYLLAPDIPGFGYSDDLRPFTKPNLLGWLDAFCEAIPVPQAGLLGHSFGGSLAVEYAARQPERVNRLVLLAPSLLAAERYPRWLRGLGRYRVAHWAMSLGTALSQVNLEKQSRKAVYKPERLDASLWQRRAQDYRLSRASAATLLAEALHDGREALPRVTQPTAIVWGEEDRVIRPAAAAQLATALAQAPTRVFFLAECGHIPMIERPDVVVSIAREWFRV